MDNIFGIFCVCVTLIGITGLILIVEDNKQPMCEMAFQIDADVNISAINNFNGVLSNVTVHGFDIKAPCGSDGMIDMYSLVNGG